MGVLNPLKVVITNYPEDKADELTAPNHPQNPEMGSRTVPFCREIYIERDDFMEDAPKKFFRLAPGREVRLRYAYFLKCVDVVKDEQTGEVIYGPDIISRGFVFEDQKGFILEDAKCVVLEVLDEIESPAHIDWTEVAPDIKKRLKRFFFKVIERSPLILPIIIPV